MCQNICDGCSVVLLVFAYLLLLSYIIKSTNAAAVNYELIIIEFSVKCLSHKRSLSLKNAKDNQRYVDILLTPIVKRNINLYDHYLEQINQSINLAKQNMIPFVVLLFGIFNFAKSVDLARGAAEPPLELFLEEHRTSKCSRVYYKLYKIVKIDGKEERRYVESWARRAGGENKWTRSRQSRAQKFEKKQSGGTEDKFWLESIHRGATYRYFDGDAILKTEAASDDEQVEVYRLTNTNLFVKETAARDRA